MKVRVLGPFLLAAAVFFFACRNPGNSPEVVRKAIIDAGVIGEAPAEVERKLRSLSLPGDMHLEVDNFDATRRLVAASVRDAEGKPGKSSYLNIAVEFDSALKATTVEAHLSAVSPP